MMSLVGCVTDGYFSRRLHRRDRFSVVKILRTSFIKGFSLAYLRRRQPVTQCFRSRIFVCLLKQRYAKTVITHVMKLSLTGRLDWHDMSRLVSHTQIQVTCPIFLWWTYDVAGMSSLVTSTMTGMMTSSSLLLVFPAPGIISRDVCTSYTVCQSKFCWHLLSVSAYKIIIKCPLLFFH